jgi:serine/threonine protein kinase
MTGQLVAIKQVEVSSLTTDEIYKITKEALYLESFTHKNIIKFINSFIHNNNFYTIMMFAQGDELNMYVSEQKILSENEAKRIFKQMQDAVNYIHSKNVIHRDLKPNIILFLDKARMDVCVYLYSNFRLLISVYLGFTAVI